MHPRRMSVALACALLGASAAVAVAEQPAAAQPASSTITIFLKAPQPAALDRLATRHDLSRAARLAALRTLVPSAATHAAVGQQLARSGYRVLDETSWSITAVGEAATSTRLFGSRPTTAYASRAALTGALPRVPLQLKSSVAAVFPTAAGPAAFHHATSTLDGSAFRNAYTPAHVTPPSGRNDGKATVATLQLANFHGTGYGNFSNSVRAADLAGYATRHHISDPVATKRYVAVKVDGGPRYNDDYAGGNTPDVEVNLDQQSILSTAPSAHQQAYFAPNTDAGYNDVFAHVYDDVTGNSHATHKNPNIVAMSVSWGGCEADTGRKAITTLEPILKSLIAAGVTVFASAGDAGIYDCSSTPDAGVDYPGLVTVGRLGRRHAPVGRGQPAQHRHQLVRDRVELRRAVQLRGRRDGRRPVGRVRRADLPARGHRRRTVPQQRPPARPGHRRERRAELGLSHLHLRPRGLRLRQLLLPHARDRRHEPLLAGVRGVADERAGRPGPADRCRRHPRRAVLGVPQHAHHAERRFPQGRPRHRAGAERQPPPTAPATRPCTPPADTTRSPASARCSGPR